MITSSKEIQEDSSIDQSLRPQTFEDYIGQDQIKKNLSISIQAAQKRGDAPAGQSPSDRVSELLRHNG